MRKSNLQLLQDAIANGDLEQAQTLTAKLIKAGNTKTSKTSLKEKTPKVTKTLGREKKTGKRVDLSVDDVPDAEYLAPSRPNGHEDVGGRKFIGSDGKEHVYGKRVSMKGTKFTNTFNPAEYNSLPSNQQKLEKKIKSIQPVPRPGQRGADRDVSKKIDAQCTICRTVVQVYPWEVETVDGESSFRCSKKSCVRAR